jgi:copper chaperone CopZ
VVWRVLVHSDDPFPDVVRAFCVIGKRMDVVSSPFARALHTQEVYVRGLLCAQRCGAAVERAARAVHGVQSAEVNFAEGKLTVTGTHEPAEVIAAVSILGYETEWSSPANLGQLAQLRIRGMEWYVRILERACESVMCILVVRQMQTAWQRRCYL